MPKPTCPTSTPLRLAAAAAACAAGVLVSAPAWAESIIKNPGDHPDYSVELEPHVLLQYGYHFWGADEGIGLGFRATIPFLDNGPISTINNNMGIGFGGDWAYFHNDDCWGADWWDDGDGCNGYTLLFPVVLQWNFFLTDIISVFGEPGLAVGYWHGERDGWCGPSNNRFRCDDDDSEFDPILPVFWGGGRFLFGETIGLTVRLGWPNISVGLSILI